MTHASAQIISVLKQKNYLALAIASGLVFFSIFVTLPVFTTAGNSLSFQLSLFTIANYLLFGLLAIMAGLTIALNTYVIKNKLAAKRARPVLSGTVSGASGTIAAVFSSVVGTSSCASCLSALFGLVGIGGGSVLFVLNNQTYFLTGAIIVSAAALYLSARQAKKCNNCSTT